MASAHLVNPKPGSHWVPETSMHQRHNDLLIPSYQVLLWLQISAVPKPPSFGSKAVSSLKLLTRMEREAVVGEGSDKTWRDQDVFSESQGNDRVLDEVSCSVSQHRCPWSLETFLMCISQTQRQPLDYVFLSS